MNSFQQSEITFIWWKELLTVLPLNHNNNNNKNTFIIMICEKEMILSFRE